MRRPVAGQPSPGAATTGPRRQPSPSAGATPAPRLLDRRVDWFEVAYRVEWDRSDFRSESEWSLVHTDGDGRRRFERPDGTSILLGEPAMRPIMTAAGTADAVTGELVDEDMTPSEVRRRDPLLALRTAVPIAGPDRPDGTRTLRSEGSARRVIDTGEGAVTRYLQQRAKLAKRHGRVRVTLGPLVDGMMKAPTNPGRYVIQGRDAVILVDLRARERDPGLVGGVRGSNLVVQWRATSLAERGFDLSVSRAMAASFGQVRAERQMRFDLAATFFGWALRDSDRKGLVHRSRCKPDRFYVLESDEDLAQNDNAAGKASPEYSRRKGKGSARRRRAVIEIRAHGAQKCTGFTVGMGGPLSARIYDKLAELLAKGEIRLKKVRVLCTPSRVAWQIRGVKKKGLAELALWADAGLDLEAVTWAALPAITRVEFQLRGEVLDEFRVRVPEAVAGRLDPIWRYLVGVDGDKRALGWLRMVLPDATGPRRGKLRACRKPIDPRWSAVRAVAWGAADRGVAARERRIPRDPQYKQGVGVLFACLAAEHRLPAIPPRFRGNETLARTVVPGVAVHLVQAYVRRAVEEFGEIVIGNLFAEKGENGALEYLFTRIDALTARFKRDTWEDEVDRRIERHCANAASDEDRIVMRLYAEERYGRAEPGSGVIAVHKFKRARLAREAAAAAAATGT